MSRAPELLAAVEDALELRQSRAVELQARVPVERRLLATVVPLEHAGAAPGAPTLVITFRDLTEQDRLARMRADFVANASHELRTPLASLKGYVETLQGSAKDDADARERFLKIMAEQAERMSRLVDDLLSLSRVEMREYLPLSDEVELGVVLTEVAQTLEPLAKRAGVTLTLSRSDGEAIVRGDRDELLQVFQNLVQNAVKYGRSGGKVDIRMTREPAASGRPEGFRVDVTDDGPGIAPQHLPRLTERFYRVNVAASREKGGTGLGLAIVKHILNRHRGEAAHRLEARPGLHVLGAAACGSGLGRGRISVSHGTGHGRGPRGQRKYCAHQESSVLDPLLPCCGRASCAHSCIAQRPVCRERQKPGTSPRRDAPEKTLG